MKKVWTGGLRGLLRERAIGGYESGAEDKQVRKDNYEDGVN